MEQRLREHFAEEARDLNAPEDLWERIEGRLGKQQQPRFASLRGGAAAIREIPWIPAAAAAVLVVGVGLGAWALAGSNGSSGDDDADAPAAVAAASDRGRVEAMEQSAAAEEAAYATAEATGAPRAAATRAAPQEAAATEAPAEQPRSTPEPTQAAAATQAAATQAATTEAAATQAAAVAEAEATEATAAETSSTQVNLVQSQLRTGSAITTGGDQVQDESSRPPEPGNSLGMGGGSDDEMDAEMADDMGDYEDAGMDADMGDYDDAGMDADMSEEMPEAGDSAPPDAEEPTEPAEPDADDAAPPEPEAPADTTFVDYDRTPFLETATDAVSTFSLDTDRTSYFLALTWVSNGYTVEPNSVRAEEWINSFEYGYAAPADTHSFAMTSDVVRHPLDDDWHLARIALQAPELRDDVPLNVTLVLDASGSMADGNRVAIARAAAEAIRQSLGSSDRIAVVHFTTSVISAYTVEHSNPDNEDVVWSIERLAAHDSTNVQAGLNLGVQLADAARRERPDAYNYIILMSDGVANVDATDPFSILESAADADSTNPLRLITIGVGINNYNDYLLEQLAQHGNGWYRYLDDTDQARDTFSRENWLALSTPFADQARAQVTWDPAVVKAWRIVGYENRITPDHTFVQNRTEFAELPAGTATTVFYELQLHDGVVASAALGSVEVRWVDPGSGDSRSQTAQVAGRTDTGFGSADSLLRFGAIVGLAADRYSSLSPQVANAIPDYAGIHGDLAALAGELDALESGLSSSQAYYDFAFLLDQLTAAADELAPSSGYSQ